MNNLIEQENRKFENVERNRKFLINIILDFGKVNSRSEFRSKWNSLIDEYFNDLDFIVMEDKVIRKYGEIVFSGLKRMYIENGNK